MSNIRLRKTLSVRGLLKVVRNCFERIPDPIASRGVTQMDCLLSALAIFGLKYPSLLKFEQAVRHKQHIRSNLKALYGVERVPADTTLRERLDEMDPRSLRPAFKQVFAALQRGGALKQFTWLDDHYVLSVDGTGYFSSEKVRCQHCCEKHHRDGRVTHYHQMLGAVLVHPEHRQVFPLAPEPIMRTDGSRKNDCERNAAKRLLQDVRREHPHLKLLVVEDALASNGPHIRLLQQLAMRFVLGVKPGDHKELFHWVEVAEATRRFETVAKDGTKHCYRYLNGVPLNDTHFDLEVNFLECQEHKPNGRKQTFTWVTDLPISEDNAPALMRAGRARWRIENETFNTLKNQGYGFEHNYGHGHRHLATVFAQLMMLAFLIDQVQQACCQLFRAAVQGAGGRLTYLWERLRGLFLEFFVPDWETLYRSIAFGHHLPTLEPFDTS